MNIESKRCLIRDFIFSDIDNFISYHNNMDWMIFQGFKGLSKKEYEEELLKNTSISKGKQFAVVNKFTKDLIGDIYLKKENNIYLLGYTIKPEYAKKCYAYEVLTEVIKWIKSQCCKIIKAYVLPENIPSINLLKKLDFIYNSKEDDELLFIKNL